MTPLRRWQKDIEAKQYEERLVGRWGVGSTGRLGLITGRKYLPQGLSWSGVGIDGREWASRNPVILIDADEKVLNSLSDVLELQLKLSVQKLCCHAPERIIDCISTDSDTELQKFYCPDCERVRTEEVVGSKARAEAAEFQWAPDPDEYPLIP